MTTPVEAVVQLRSGHVVVLVGPEPPPDSLALQVRGRRFRDNGMGPQKLGWLAWLIPDRVRGVSLSTAGARHDWAYGIIRLIRDVRAGDDEAIREFRRYTVWAGIPLEEAALRLDLTRRDADSYLRINVRRLLASGRVRWFWREVVPWLYWAGVRFGGGPAA